MGCNSGKLFNYSKNNNNNNNNNSGLCSSLFHTFLQSVHLKIKGWISNAAKTSVSVVDVKSAPPAGSQTSPQKNNDSFQFHDLSHQNPHNCMQF